MSVTLPHPTAALVDDDRRIMREWLIALEQMAFSLVTVAGSLPSASTAGAGARGFVTDSNATLAAGLGNVVVGGGANKVPIYSDGTNWRIG